MQFSPKTRTVRANFTGKKHLYLNAIRNSVGIGGYFTARICEAQHYAMN